MNIQKRFIRIHLLSYRKAQGALSVGFWLDPASTMGTLDYTRTCYSIHRYSGDVAHVIEMSRVL